LHDLKCLAPSVEHVADIELLHHQIGIRLSEDDIVQHLVSRLEKHLSPYAMEIEVPDHTTVQYKEALVMALLGVLRWREEETVIQTVTGASRASVGGALWLGGD